MYSDFLFDPNIYILLLELLKLIKVLLYCHMKSHIIRILFSKHHLWNNDEQIINEVSKGINILVFKIKYKRDLFVLEIINSKFYEKIIEKFSFKPLVYNIG